MKGEIIAKPLQPKEERSFMYLRNMRFELILEVMD